MTVAAQVDKFTGRAAQYELAASPDPSHGHLIDHHIQCLWNGLEVDFQSVDGPPAPEIARIAMEQKYDLVVLGTHGRTGLARFLMGSVAEEVVRTCHVPVLSIHTPDEAKPL